MVSQDQITFGSVHLEVTDPERSAHFWQEVFGFARRSGPGGSIILGTNDTPLIVLHGGATKPFQKGHSGIYHVAIHPPDARDFARLFKRLIKLRYPISPTDHTFSKAIYLDDPDGINVEITLETPERFDRCIPGPGNRLEFIGTDGVARPGAYTLDLDQVLSFYEPGSELEPVAEGTKVGHIHLYVGDLERSRTFYTGLGFDVSRWWPPMQIADFGAGGVFQHRIAVNTWQGLGAPPSPAGTARMLHFELRYAQEELFQKAIAANSSAVDKGRFYELTDPSGIPLRLCKPSTQDDSATQLREKIQVA